MQIDRILYPISSLGPGKRLVIWTIGCSKHCKRCSNTELWGSNPDRDITIEDLFALITNIANEKKIDGITITGGDPFEQIEDLLALVSLLSTITKDILVYTGYTKEELDEVIAVNKCKDIYEHIAVLIVGRYIDDLNDNKSVLYGSTNQEILYLKEEYRSIYERYLHKGRMVQNVYCDGRVISVGIHNKEGQI